MPSPHQTVIRRVWIEEGCIACNLCEDLAPEVFEIPPGDSCRPRRGHEELLGADGGAGAANLTDRADLAGRVREAAASCPVEVIQLETE